MVDLIYKEEVFAIIGAAIEVHWQLGPGFLEPVYQEAMEIEVSTRGIPFVAQQGIQIKYRIQLFISCTDIDKIEHTY